MLHQAIDILPKISIHTPTKGATKTYPYGFTITGISIHTPTKGATNGVKPTGNLICNFNPHSHEGSDKQKNYIYHNG